MRLVEQDPHQFRHGERGMRVVELYGGLFGQRPPILVPFAKPANDVGDRAGDQEIFLHQAKPAPSQRMVIGIKNARQQFRVQRFGDRGDEIAAAEPLKVEGMRGRPRSIGEAC